MHVYIVDPGYGSTFGHSVDYANNIYDELNTRHINVVILSSGLTTNSHREVFDIFSENEWGYDTENRKHNDYISTNINFFQEFNKFFYENPRSEDETILLFPNVTKYNLNGITNIIDKFASRFQYKIIFRYPQTFFQSNQSKIAIEKLNQLGISHVHIDILTDTHILQAELIEKFDLPVRQIPIPIKKSSVISYPKQNDLESEKLIISTLGNPRIEKGFDKIANLILYEPLQDYLNRFCFYLQGHNPDDESIRYIDLLNENIKTNDSIAIFSQKLDHDEYLRLITKSDIVLNLYDRKIYDKRSSGPFLESLIHGKIVLTTEGTWMSQIYKYFGIDLYLDDLHPNVVYSKLIDIEANFDKYMEKISLASSKLASIHNPKVFLDVLLETSLNEYEFPYGEKAFILYPWVGTLTGRNGAHAILKAQVAYLMTNHDSVFVLGQGDEEYEFDGKFSIQSYQSDINEYSHLHQHLLWKYGSAIAYSEIMHIWHFYWPLEDLAFGRIVRHYIRNYDTIFVDYPYYLNIFMNLLDSNSVKDKVHLFLFDVLYQQNIRDKYLQENLKKLEIQNIGLVKNVYTYSHEDKEEFEKSGVQTQYINVPLLPAEISENTLTDKKLIIFVGTNHAPNILAAEKLINYLDNLGNDELFVEYQFVIIGNCYRKFNSDNWTSLGSIDSESLTEWYRKCFAVLNLQENGTGISIKTAEALMQDKIVISTSNGVRGLGIENRKNYFNINSIDELKVLLAEIKTYPEKIQQIHSNNKIFISDHNFLSAQEGIVKSKSKRNNKEITWDMPMGQRLHSDIQMKTNVTLSQFNAAMRISKMSFIKFIQQIDFIETFTTYNDFHLLIQELKQQEFFGIDLEYVIEFENRKSFNYLIFALFVNYHFKGKIKFSFDLINNQVGKPKILLSEGAKYIFQIFCLFRINREVAFKAIKTTIKLNRNRILIFSMLRIYNYFMKFKRVMTNSLSML
jgi:hypothetical protein